MEILALLLIFLLFSIGTSHLWSHSTVFLPIRIKLVEIPYIRRPLLCPECASFWIGLATATIFNPLASLPFFGGCITQCITLGIITHLFADFIYKKGYLQ